jgi:hypothetical protein
MTDTRYPYTHAADFVREHCTDLREVGGTLMRLPTLSRAEASQVMAAFEKVFGLSHEEMARKLADFALKQAA